MANKGQFQEIIFLQMSLAKLLPPSVIHCRSWLGAKEPAVSRLGYKWPHAAGP